MSDPSPSELREAWLSLVAGLESQLGATLTNARACATGHLGFRAEERRRGYNATAWAASRLLDQVKHLPAPEVPEDPVPGQGSLEELLPTEEPPVHWAPYFDGPVATTRHWMMGGTVTGVVADVTCRRCIRMMADASCDGDRSCTSPVHVHGCHADVDGVRCTDPSDHDPEQ